MNIKMISPRTIFNRKPFGKNVLQQKYAYKENYPDVKDSGELCDNENNEFWIVRTVSNQQLELYVKDCGAVLHNFTSQDNSHMFTGYTDTPIKCASFACLSEKVSTNATIESIFQELDNSHPKGVILFTENIAKYYGFNAEIHTCKLPCLISSAWAFRNCLFVERQESLQPNEYSPHSLFLMSHTLAEFTPVVFRDEFGNSGFINNTRFRIVATCDVSFLLLAYDSVDDAFSVWRIRDCTREDFANLYDKHWDGSISVKKEMLHSHLSSTRSHSELMGNNHSCNGNSHISSEYFEISSNGICSNGRTIDDLDTRSPIARCLKTTKEALIPDKMTLLHEINNSARMINPTHRQTVEPLYPKVCLDFLYQFKLPGTGDGATHSHRPPLQLIKSSGFFAEDFYRRKYLCCLRPSGDHRQLEIVKFNYEHHCFTALEEHTYRVLDAVYLDRLQLIVMLETSSALSIFTGNSLVCKISLLHSLIYEPDLFSDSGTELSTDDIHNVVRLSEPTDYGFTLHTRSNLALRLYLPEMVRFHLVKKSLLVLKKLLPISVGTTLLSRWYSLNRAVDTNEATSAEWRRFVEFLLENLGFTRDQQRDNAIVRDVKQLCLSASATDDSDRDPKRLRTDFALFSLESRNAVNRDRLEDYSQLSHNVADRLLSRYATTVLLAMHLVYESEKINFSSCLYLDNLAALNCSLACSLRAVRYIDYYVADNADLWARVNRLPSLVEFVCPLANAAVWTEEPPNWTKTFLSTLSGSGSEFRYPIIEELSEMLMHLIGIWLVLFRNGALLHGPEAVLNDYLYRISFNPAGEPCRYPVHVPAAISSAIAKRIVAIDNEFERISSYLGEINFHISDLDYLNPGVAAVFRIVFFHCNAFPHLYSILHRSDLDKQRQLVLPIIRDASVRDVMTNPLQTFRAVSESRRNCFSYWTNNVKPQTTVRQLGELAKADAHYPLAVLDSDPIVQLAHRDLRVHEAYRMLQSCCPVELDATICGNFAADDGDLLSSALKEELEAHLKIINCQRTFALPLGRGMLTLQSVRANWLQERLPVPPLCLAGRFSLSESGKQQSIENNGSAKQWPNFHNGVAAGLMVAPLNEAVDFVWILKQCSSNNIDKIELSPEQAGVLLGLGLNGHLNKLSPDTIGQTIKSMNEMATMAILIGLSAFNLGSKNSALSKHISFHYRRLIPGEKDHSDPVPSLCQVSAIIAAGLLNFKSGDRKMAKIFIDEMGRSREHLALDGSPPLDIELTSATAGFSVGLIMFQQGDSVFCRENNPEELSRLLGYLKGTHRVQQKDTSCTGPGDAPSDAHIRTVLKNHDLKRPQPISDVDSWSALQSRNPRVQEGEYYNVDITGSGAAVALGLIFMASGNEVIGAQLQCPSTFYLLEQVRSPLLCFRQIAHGLVMWRSVRGSQQWVDSTIPTFVATKAFVHRPSGIAEKYLETANEGYLQMLVGSCFVMGLRYAGTDDVGARSTIINYIEKLIYIKSDAELIQNINRNQYDWAVSTLFLSVCMVSAGSGDLQLLRMSRYLRSIHYPKDCSNYGVNMAYSMSIGLLFLGGGKLTLSNTPRCAAILLIAFFPRFPPTYSGRRYHLQSLRHLYVIATRPRVMCAVDLDTQTAVPFNARIKLKNDTVREYEGCLVYPPDNPALIEQIELFDKDGKYWPQIYRPGTEPWDILLQSLHSGAYFFVKKRSSESDIDQLVGSFRLEDAMLTRNCRGYQLGDCRLLVNLVDAIHQHQQQRHQEDPDSAAASDVSCTTIRIHEKIVDFVFSNATALKQIIINLQSVDISDYHQLAMFLDWCHQNGLMTIWSVFSSYFDLSLHSMKSVTANDNSGAVVLLDEEEKLVIREILK